MMKVTESISAIAKAPKTIAVLGSTGSIGTSTLDVVRQFGDRFRVAALAAGENVDLLVTQIREFSPRLVAVKSSEAASRLVEKMASIRPKPEVLWGMEGMEAVATVDEASIVVCAIVGAAGLIPTIAAVRAGKDIALANKETLVAAGDLVTRCARDSGANILPVDSEHSAIFQALQGNPRRRLRRILLTASGGPFFRTSSLPLDKVTPADALQHPNWSMGPKVTIDSASLMNKGLEVIEARWLFDVPVDAISVHIHPESIVHSMVEYVDGSVIAQMGVPDMRIPIAYALSYPDRLPVEAHALDFFALRQLTFYPPDLDRFPCLRLAFEAGRRGDTCPAVLNAANEIAVSAFLEEKIRFTDIPRVIEKVLSRHGAVTSPDLETILDSDQWAREEAKAWVWRLRM